MHLYPPTTFVPVPNPLLQRTDISSSEKLVFARLIQYCENQGPQEHCSVSQEELANEIGLRLPAVQRCLKRLQRAGLIKSYRPTGINRLLHGNNTYVLTWHNWLGDTAEGRLYK